MLIFSSSPRVFGSMAYDSTGAAKAIGAKERLLPAAHSVSEVCVSRSLVTAPMSPALNLRDGILCLALHNGQTAKPLRCLLRRVLHRLIGCQCSRRHAEQRDPAGERIGNRFQTNATDAALSPAS